MHIAPNRMFLRSILSTFKPEPLNTSTLGSFTLQTQGLRCRGRAARSAGNPGPATRLSLRKTVSSHVKGNLVCAVRNILRLKIGL